MGSDDAGHASVLLREALELLAVRPGGLWVDGTVGLGGHAEAILRASVPDGRLLGTDRDGETLERARARLAPFGDRARLVQSDFRDVPRHLAGEAADGILLDLGVSSVQLDDPERGFSFQAEGPLDMRLDRTARTTAADLVNGLPERDLADVIYEYGEEPASRRIARAIVREREREPIRTTTRLADVVRARRAPLAPPRPAPGDAHLPGAAHPHEPRARPAARGAHFARRVPAARRSPRRDRVPLARGPPGQADVPRARRPGLPRSSEGSPSGPATRRPAATRAPAARACARLAREERAA